MADTCLVLNRWTDDFSRYEDFIDHREYNVAYVTVPAHAERIPPGLAAHVEVVEDVADRAAVLGAAERCRDAVGPIGRVVALSEFDLLMGAEVREHLGVPGYTVPEIRRFRDKIEMKQAVRDAGLRVPVHADLDDDDATSRLTRQPGFPVVVKPRGGAASVGCEIVEDAETLARLRDERRGRNHECEEYVSGPIYHVDGLVSEGRLLFAKAWRYINTCYDFANGRALGSVMLEDASAQPIIGFARRVLGALGLRRGAFHLEIIEDDRGLCFLEIGARVGGGEIPFVIRDLFGVDLVREWLRLELGGADEGGAFGPGRSPTQQPLGGFLMLPEPVGYRLAARNSPGKEIAGLYDSVLPEVGHVFDGEGGYERLLGRFRFRAETSADVEAAIHRTQATYRYELLPTREAAKAQEGKG
jgi:hypothetical protein